MTLEYFDAGGFLRPGPTSQDWAAFGQYVMLDASRLPVTLKFFEAGETRDMDALVTELKGTVIDESVSDTADDLLKAAADADLLLIISGESDDAEG